MSAKMMSVNPNPNQNGYQSVEGVPTGCGAVLPRMSPKGTSTVQKFFHMPVPAEPDPGNEKHMWITKGQTGIDSPTTPRSVTTSPGDSSEFSTFSDSDLPTTRSATRLHEAKKISASRSPGSSETEPGDSSECSTSDSERPSLHNAKSASENVSLTSPDLPSTDPGSDSDLDRSQSSDQVLIKKLLHATVQRAQRVLEQGGDRINASLANALQQYIDTASAMQKGVARKDHVLAMIEYVEPLLASISIPKEVEKRPTSTRSTKQNNQWLLSANDMGSSVHSDSHSSGSNLSSPEMKQESPRLIHLAMDDPHCSGSDANSSSPGASVTTLSPRKYFRAAPDEDESDILVLTGSPENGSEVFLHVYDVGILAPSVHKVLAALGTGAYHVGVEVYGREFSYGNTDVGGGGELQSDVTGVGVQHTPRKHCSHAYYGSVSLGRTELSHSQLKELIKELKLLWPARSYHTLRNNCVSFAEVFCARLGVSPPPEHVGALAKGLKDFLF